LGVFYCPENGEGGAMETKQRERARPMMIRLPASDARKLWEMAEADDRPPASLARILVQRGIREKAVATD